MLSRGEAVERGRRKRRIVFLSFLALIVVAGTIKLKVIFGVEHDKSDGSRGNETCQLAESTPLAVISDSTPSPNFTTSMKVLVQNLQKRGGLATKLFEEYDPDVMLVQEVNVHHENYHFQASNVSKMGYGTAIGSKLQVTNVKFVQSPFAEFGGFVRKKTTVATVGSVQFVSFHGYNGQPFKDEGKLLAHVEAVLAEIDDRGPALFAGDFNTWTKEHSDLVTERMERAGFRSTYSWPYHGRDLPLDHAYVRELNVRKCLDYACASDHRGAILELDV